MLNVKCSNEMRIRQTFLVLPIAVVLNRLLDIVGNLTNFDF